MTKKILCLLMMASVLSPALAGAHEGFNGRDEVIHETAYWTGDRFADGRPKVPDAVLDKMKTVTLEEAWATLRSAGFLHQYEDGWMSIFPDKVLVGRALTSSWMPGRPDIQKIIEEDGKADGRKLATNSWPVDMLQPRDVYVSDHFGLKTDGPSIGDNVGNAIYARSGNGIVYDGAVRDINGLKELPNFTSFVRSYDPSHHYGRLAEGNLLNSTMVAINAPTRIGGVLVMPGDVILGRDGGVMFIPPQLAERVVNDSMRTRLEDTFSHQRLAEEKYTAGQIDGAWAPEIQADYVRWLRDNIDKMAPYSHADIQRVIDERTRPRPPRPAPGARPPAPPAAIATRSSQESEMTSDNFIDRRNAALGLAALGASLAAPSATQAQGAVRKIVFWAGPKEHGAPGRHEYERDQTEHAWQLEHATNIKGVKTLVKVVGKPPRDISELDDADALVIFGNGAWLRTETGILFPQDQDTDGRTYDAEHMAWLNKLDAVIKQRKMGLAIFHYTMWVDNWVGKRFLMDWFGGNWLPYSSHNPVDTWTVSPLPVRHPILNGIKPWTYRDEMFSRYFLYNDPRRTALLQATPANPSNGAPETVSWVFARPDGGRSFVWGGSDFHDNMHTVPEYRNYLLNAIAWIAGLEIPAEGVIAPPPPADDPPIPAYQPRRGPGRGRGRGPVPAPNP